MGFVSMSWWLVLLATWQAGYGSVYSEIGLLTALFMAGTAAGALATRHLEGPKLELLFPGAAGLSLLLASAPPAWSAPALLVVSGCVTGAAFHGLAELGGGRIHQGTGRAFAADEIGAGLAALFVGVLALPWLGTTAISLTAAALSTAVVPGLLMRRAGSESVDRGVSRRNPG